MSSNPLRGIFPLDSSFAKSDDAQFYIINFISNYTCRAVDSVYIVDRNEVEFNIPNKFIVTSVNSIVLLTGVNPVQYYRFNS